MKTRVFVFSILFVICAAFRGSPDTLQKLEDTVKSVQNDDAVKQGLLSVCVMRTDSAITVFEWNSDKCMIPASTMKIFTTGAALALLGEDFRFETKIEAGSFDSTSGTVRGNIWIRGSGDPSLQSQYFKSDTDTSLAMQWALILKKKGVKKIEGAVIADASCFEEDPIPPGWIWGDIGNYYGAGAHGLNWRDNKYTLYFNSGAAGTKSSYSRMKPEIAGLKISGEVTASGSKDEAYIYGAPFSSWHQISGSIPPGRSDYEVDGAMPDPPLVCAKELRDALISLGITVKDSATTKRHLDAAGKSFSEKLRLLYTHKSAPLSKIVYQTNIKSDNVYAESLMKALARQKGATGNDITGTQAIMDYWKSKGADLKGMNMSDGSGLSRSNLVTSRQQTDLLRIIRSEKWSETFYNSLPVAGNNLCDGTVAENNLRAKSGYINRARGYTGYVKDHKGRLLAFSVLANNYSCTPSEMKKKIEKILVKIAEIDD